MRTCLKFGVSLCDDIAETIKLARSLTSSESLETAAINMSAETAEELCKFKAASAFICVEPSPAVSKFTNDCCWPLAESPPEASKPHPSTE